MWEDVLKNQISIPKQSIRTSRRALPEKSPELCYPKFHDIVQRFYDCSKIFGTSFVAKDASRLLTNDEWCENWNYTYEDSNKNERWPSENLFDEEYKPRKILEVSTNNILQPTNTVDATFSMFLKYITIELQIRWKWSLGKSSGADDKKVIVLSNRASIVNSITGTRIRMGTFYHGFDETEMDLAKHINYVHKLVDWMSSVTSKFGQPHESTALNNFHEKWQKMDFDVRTNNKWYLGGTIGDIFKSNLKTGLRQSIRTSKKPLPEKTREICKPKVLKLGEFIDDYKIIVKEKIKRFIKDKDVNDPPIYRSNHRFPELSDTVGEMYFREMTGWHDGIITYVVGVKGTYSFKFTIKVVDLENVEEWSACKAIECWNEAPEDRWNGVSKYFDSKTKAEGGDKSLGIRAGKTNPKSQNLGGYYIVGEEVRGRRWEIELSWGYGFANTNETYLQQEEHVAELLNIINTDKMKKEFDAILGSPIKKSQISIPKQKIKTKRRPLPEKTPPDCYKIIDDIFQAWADCNKVQRPKVLHARDSGTLSQFTNEDWCEMVKDRNNNLIIHPANQDDPDLFSVRYYIYLTDKKTDNVQLFLHWAMSKRFNKWRVWQYAEIDFLGYSSHIMGSVMIDWEEEPNVFTSAYITKLLDTCKNCLNFADKLEQMKPFVNKLRHGTGDYSQAQRLIFDMAGDGDISKNQITVPKQSVRTRRLPLPEKSQPEDCYPKIHNIVQEFFNAGKPLHIPVQAINGRDSLKQGDWCTHYYNKSKMKAPYADLQERLFRKLSYVPFSFGIKLGSHLLSVSVRVEEQYYNKKLVLVYFGYLQDYGGNSRMIHKFNDRLRRDVFRVNENTTYSNWQDFFFNLREMGYSIRDWVRKVNKDLNANYDVSLVHQQYNELEQVVKDTQLYKEFMDDIKKNQITIPKQGIKTSKRPLPEKTKRECIDEVAGWKNSAFRKAVLLKKILIDANVANSSTIIDLKYEDFKIIDGELKEYCCCKMIEAINQVVSGEQNFKQNVRTGSTISNYLDKQYPFEFKGEEYVLACQFTSASMRKQKSMIGFVATLYDNFYEGSIKDKYTCDIVVESMLDNYEIIPAEIKWW